MWATENIFPLPTPLPTTRNLCISNSIINAERLNGTRWRSLLQYWIQRPHTAIRIRCLCVCRAGGKMRSPAVFASRVFHARLNRRTNWKRNWNGQRMAKRNQRTNWTDRDDTSIRLIKRTERVANPQITKKYGRSFYVSSHRHQKHKQFTHRFEWLILSPHVVFNITSCYVRIFKRRDMTKYIRVLGNVLRNTF